MEQSFFDVVSRQRACRSYREDPVDDETLEMILSAATKAPSSENMQPWEFVVVRDSDLRAALGDRLRKIWSAGGYERLKARVSASMAADVDSGQMGGIAAAPVLIVVAGDTRRVQEKWLASSIFPSVQNILLAANALGLGSALTTLAVSDRRAIQDLLGLPDEVHPLALVPIGHPRRALGPPGREPFGQHAWRDRFGEAW